MLSQSNWSMWDVNDEDDPIIVEDSAFVKDGTRNHLHVPDTELTILTKGLFILVQSKGCAVAGSRFTCRWRLGRPRSARWLSPAVARAADAQSARVEAIASIVLTPVNRFI